MQSGFFEMFLRLFLQTRNDSMFRRKLREGVFNKIPTFIMYLLRGGREALKKWRYSMYASVNEQTKKKKKKKLKREKRLSVSIKTTLIFNDVLVRARDTYV